jgi:hypothetical protein
MAAASFGRLLILRAENARAAARREALEGGSDPGDVRRSESAKQQDEAAQRQPRAANGHRDDQGVVEALAVVVVHDVQHPGDVPEPPGVVLSPEDFARGGRNQECGPILVGELHAPDRQGEVSRLERRAVDARHRAHRFVASIARHGERLGLRRVDRDRRAADCVEQLHPGGRGDLVDVAVEQRFQLQQEHRRAHAFLHGGERQRCGRGPDLRHRQDGVLRRNLVMIQQRHGRAADSPEQELQAQDQAEPLVKPPDQEHRRDLRRRLCARGAFCGSCRAGASLPWPPSRRPPR